MANHSDDPGAREMVNRSGAGGGIPSLSVALSDTLTAEELKRLARLTGRRVPLRKAELVEHVLEHLAGDRLRTVWLGLDELQKAAVAEVVHSRRSSFTARRFLARYGELPDFGTLRRTSREGHISPLRLFLFGWEADGSVMPDDLRERLKAFVPPPVEATVKSLEELPAVYDQPFERWKSRDRTLEKGTEAVPLVVRETERSAQRELISVLRLVDAGKVAVSDKTRRPSTAAVEAITRVLEGGDYYAPQPLAKGRQDEDAGPIRAFAWPLLVQAGGLAQLSGSKLSLTKAGRKALAEPAAQTLKTLWTKWRGTSLLDELSRIDCVKGQTGKGKRGLTAVSTRREAVSDSLSACPVRRWVGTDELARFVQASDNPLCVTRNAWGLYISEPHYGSLGYEGSSALLEGRYLLCLLLEYAATLGLVDVAYVPPAGARRDYGQLWGTDELAFFSRYDGLMFIRLNALGAFCLGVAKSYEAAPMAVKPVLKVLPCLDVVATGADLEPGDRMALEGFAVRTSDVVWKLERGRLLSAIEEGRPVAELRELLVTRSGAELPDTVQRLLEDVAERSARICDRGPARLVECADSALAALVANDARTRKHCLRAGDRHLVVPASSDSAFRRGVREAGYLVAPGKAWAALRERTATDEPGDPPAEP